MQSSFSTICTLLVYFQIFIVSAIKPGYDCDDTFIPESRLKEIVGEVRRASWYHLLWPVSPTTKIYEEAAKTPYRAALDSTTFQVFSVIIKNEDYVKECRLREQLPLRNITNDFNCSPYYVYQEDLEIAASKACPKILNVARDNYPVRYEGPPFQGCGKQLYVYPVAAFIAYRGRKESSKFAHRFLESFRGNKLEL